MQQIGDNLGSGTTDTFQTTVSGDVWLRATGTITTLTIQESIDNSTWATLNTDGTDQTLTAAGYKKYSLPGGVYFRVAITSGSGVDVYVDGIGAKIIQ